MAEIEAGATAGLADDDLRPNAPILIGGAITIGVISALSLPWPLAVASTVLGVLMVAGAEVDARTFLLPDWINWSAVICGVVAAALLNPPEPWMAMGESIVRAGCIAGALALFRAGYEWRRRVEGLGWGDVKLGAAIGAWLPLETVPMCFGIATGAALLAVMLARLKGEPVTRTTRIPFGAFLCPALWVVFYADHAMR